jgi:hypothetical protein
VNEAHREVRPPTGLIGLNFRTHSCRRDRRGAVSVGKGGKEICGHFDGKVSFWRKTPRHPAAFPFTVGTKGMTVMAKQTLSERDLFRILSLRYSPPLAGWTARVPKEVVNYRRLKPTACPYL